MVPATPKSELTLTATSAADDAGFVALNDMAGLLQRQEFSTSLVIGGHMVGLHARRWDLNLFRETQDTDLGVPQLALNRTDIRPAMSELGYEQQFSNRFVKPIPDSSGDPEGSPALQAIVDILVPALTSHPRRDVEVGDITTIEVPGLAEALNRKPVALDLTLRLRNSQILTCRIRIPDERSALMLKVMAWDVRRAGKDAIDVWRCLEIVNVAPEDARHLASDDGARALAILNRAFAAETAEGISALARAQNLNPVEKRQRATRVRALIGRLNQ